MSKSKVCILAAGRGTRLGDYTKVLNKGLLPLEGKAIISHIIEKFPSSSRFVIAIGYKGEAVKNYCELAHPGLDLEFVTVADYAGPTSGPGASLMACKDALEGKPFFFVTCDTYWTVPIEKFSTDRSWVALDLVDQNMTHHYSTVEVADGKVKTFSLKKNRFETRKEAFTGLAFVKETDIFWEALKASQITLGEKQVIEAFQQLANQDKLFSEFIDWVDLGLIENYQNQLKKHGQYDFSKVHEAFYMLSGTIIKYFDNEQDSAQRVSRAQLNPTVFPKITGHRKHMYSYAFQPGNTLYEDDRPEVFRKLLAWLNESLWQPQNIDSTTVNKVCDLFYREKTLGRIDQFKKKYPDYIIDTINGETIPSTESLLQKISWESFADGIPCFIHGDLQPDNIIYDSVSDKFVLLDWRQNFAGQITFGDLYYDFAKLWGGLNLNYKEIKNNSFSYSEADGSCTYSHPQHKYFKPLSAELEALAVKKNLSVEKIRLLVGLIYLNMSPLHHYPFDKMLYAMGRKILFDAQK